MTLTYNHTGIPVREKMEGMIYVESLKVWITDFAKHPWKIEYLYFEPDSICAGCMQTMAHVAYLTDDIEAATAGKTIVAPITDLGFAKMAYIFEGGLPVELLQMKQA